LYFGKERTSNLSLFALLYTVSEKSIFLGCSLGRIVKEKYFVLCSLKIEQKSEKELNRAMVFFFCSFIEQLAIIKKTNATYTGAIPCEGFPL